MRMKHLASTLFTASVLALSACQPGSQTTEAPQESTAPVVTLDTVLAHARRDEDRARDPYRHPKETLEFFEVTPDKQVAEIWPGWYADVIAPYMASGSGTYTAVLLPNGLGERYDARNAAFQEKYSDADVYGDVQFGGFYKGTENMVPEGSQDVVLTFRNVHNWMGGGYEAEAFNVFYKALKPGGILGVVEHRLPESATQSPKADSGYVQESYMKALAADAGFEFVGSSEVNANSKDTADHPFGVWTLPPRSRVPAEDDPDAADFDAQFYKDIGESDRATLKFRKPL